MTADALARTSAIGPYFAVDTGPREDAAHFRPLSRLYADPAVLDDTVAEVGRRMGTEEKRVAASTLQLGVASRLWSVALGAAGLTGRVPELDPGLLRWRSIPSGPIALWLPDPVVSAVADPADALHEVVVVRNLMPFADVVHRRFRLSPRIVRGNAASALVGTLRVLLTQRPDAAENALPLARALLDRTPLREAGVFSVLPGPDVSFRRNSCCLYYRVSSGNLCGDCVLHRPRRGTGPAAAE